MELAPAGVPLSFEVTFDSPSLYVGMAVYNDSGSTPVQVGSVIAMLNIPGTNTYRGKFSASANFNYIIIKGVYTDNTYTTYSSNYAQGSESIVAQNIGGPNPGVGGTVVGFVQPAPALVGIVNC
jgi:hypothetical protein